MTQEVATTKTGKKVSFYRTTNDYYGNPRYIVHFLDLGLNRHESNNLTRRAGLKKYSGKSFGGGFVFQSYNVDSSADFFESLGLLRDENN